MGRAIYGRWETTALDPAAVSFETAPISAENVCSRLLSLYQPQLRHHSLIADVPAKSAQLRCLFRVTCVLESGQDDEFRSLLAAILWTCVGGPGDTQLAIGRNSSRPQEAVSNRRWGSEKREKCGFVSALSTDSLYVLALASGHHLAPLVTTCRARW